MKQLCHELSITLIYQPKKLNRAIFEIFERKKTLANLLKIQSWINANILFVNRAPQLYNY